MPSRSSKHVSVLSQSNAPSSRNVKQVARNGPAQECYDFDMPGTPPIDEQSRRMWGEATTKQTEAQRLVEQEKLQTEHQHVARRAAALIIQRLVHCFLARTRLSTRLSAVGRPVELRIMGVQSLQLLCDYRNITSVYCNVRVLKKPFGPFMFHFSTSKCTNICLPTWTDTFFVPMLSSKCDIVVTLIGVTNTGGFRFLGQAIAPMEPGWENKTKIGASLAKWKFPVEEGVVGLNRFAKGTVELEIKPISSRMPCKSGQFLLAPPITTRARRSFSFWTRKVSSNGPLASPIPVTPKKTPTSSPPLQKTVATRWGVLTDTSFYLFDNKTANLLTSLDLAKLQMIKSSPQPKSDPSRLYPLKLYARGIMYVLYVSSYAQQQSWEYKINLHRRELLIP
ncbi:unnamed protein product [Peronospora belbahrii]|uniref:C2 domain-containing protein n=1 Tax=Peronospora belbahrii TaxID=622444 RepID=A0AAU9L8R4_9STRA|nr:unnamed protein product [Peronospora belbahrii]CAH0522276.1 unnamed protein product [Peronospora belbahrii]